MKTTLIDIGGGTLLSDSGRLMKQSEGRMTSLSAGYAICGALQNALGDSVTAVYPVMANENAEYPYVVYYRTDSEGEPTKERTLFDTTTIVVEVYDEDYDRSVDLIEAVRDAIENRRIEYTDDLDSHLRLMVNCSRIEGSSEEFDIDCYKQAVTIQCKIQ